MLNVKSRKNFCRNLLNKISLLLFYLVICLYYKTKGGTCHGS
nr:MAG TPA: hypothetical protein [Caudoviricetes sp.]